jgi:hypothetical protein
MPLEIVSKGAAVGKNSISYACEFRTIARMTACTTGGFDEILSDLRVVRRGLSGCIPFTGDHLLERTGLLLREVEEGDWARR